MRDAKSELKRRILHRTRGRLNQYLLSDLDRAKDPRVKEMIEELALLMEQILAIADEYIVLKLDPPDGPADLPGSPTKEIDVHEIGKD